MLGALRTAGFMDILKAIVWFGSYNRFLTVLLSLSSKHLKIRYPRC